MPISWYCSTMWIRVCITSGRWNGNGARGLTLEEKVLDYVLKPASKAMHIVWEGDRAYRITCYQTGLRESMLNTFL